MGRNLLLAISFVACSSSRPTGDGGSDGTGGLGGQAGQGQPDGDAGGNAGRGGNSGEVGAGLDGGDGPSGGNDGVGGAGEIGGSDAASACTEGEHVCVGDEVRRCEGGRPDVVVMACSAGMTCRGGSCIATACANIGKSYLGCEYWPVDLDNAIETQGTLPAGGRCAGVAGALQEKPSDLAICTRAAGGARAYVGLCDYGGDCSQFGADARCDMRTVCALDGQHAPYAVAVANPDKVNPVEVVLENVTGITHKVTVPPGMIVPIFPQQVGFPDQSLDHSGIEPKAYRLRSNRPVAAYQFNPLENVGVFTNDASLLLPSNTFDRRYYGLTYPSLYQAGLSYSISHKGYVTVVASAPGTTTIDVSVTAAVRPGRDVAAIPAGGKATFVLKQFDTLNLETGGSGDLSGSLVTGDRPFGMYAGHEASRVAETPQCCADHLEDSLFPASTWGKVYAVAHSASNAERPATLRDLVRVMAQEPDTRVTFTPASGSCPALGPGQFCEMWIAGDVEVSADKPILVAHYLAAAAAQTTDGISGDPSLSFVVPTEQYRKEYTVLVPDKYRESYVSIIVPSAGTVSLDGMDVTSRTAPFGSGSLRAARVRLAPGQHTFICPMGCGIEIYGWGGAVSYMYAGGLDLKCINPGGTAGGTCD